MIHRAFFFVSVFLLFFMILGGRYFHSVLVSHDFNDGFFFPESPDSQRYTAYFLGILFAGFTSWQYYLRKQLPNVVEAVAEVAFMLFLALGILGYLASKDMTKGFGFWVFIAGLTTGQAVSVLHLWWKGGTNRYSIHELLLNPLICVLTMTAIFQPNMKESLLYREQARWTGLLGEPNVFGLLMGVGLILAAGKVIGMICFRKHMPSWISLCLYVLAILITANSLIKSYSRGAWIATVCALAYLAWSAKRRFIKNIHGETPGNMASKGRGILKWIIVLVAASLIILYWNFQYTEQPTMRRALSVANINDFSWRNRVAASVGALTMMSEKPWFGFGWTQSGSMFDEYYRLAELSEHGAIRLNDYFVIGITLGIPALVCLVTFTYLRFLNAHREFFRERCDSTAWSIAIYRAAFVVLLIGFVPGRGLFLLATGTIFWVLFRLGCPDTVGTAKHREQL